MSWAHVVVEDKPGPNPHKVYVTDYETEAEATNAVARYKREARVAGLYDHVIVNRAVEKLKREV